jgi:hypothetical protein
VSVSTIKRYLRLRRQTGDVQPKLIPGPPARKKRALLKEVLPTQITGSTLTSLWKSIASVSR